MAGALQLQEGLSIPTGQSDRPVQSAQPLGPSSQTIAAYRRKISADVGNCSAAQGPELEGIVDLGALPAEVARRGLVRRDNSFTSRYRGVCWDKKSKKWQARVVHDGKREYLGLFATEGEAKARCDARCLELGQDQDAGTSSAFRGVGWDKATSKWNASIKVDGKNKGLGRFEATARGEVYAALAFDVAARAAGRPEKANFEPAERARGPHGGAAQRPASQNFVMPNTETVAGTDMNGVAEETAPPGSICSAAEAPEPRKGVSWNAAQSKWEAEIKIRSKFDQNSQVDPAV